MSNIDAVLSERGGTHGAFADNAKSSQNIKHAMRESGGHYYDLPFVHREALDMIAHKIARILSGNTFYHDHWMDIAGYACLVSLTLVDSIPVTITATPTSGRIFDVYNTHKSYGNMPNALKLPLATFALALGYSIYRDPQNRYLWDLVIEQANAALLFCEKMPDEQSSLVP